jgi:hypothetical protein
MVPRAGLEAFTAPAKANICRLQLPILNYFKIMQKVLHKLSASKSLLFQCSFLKMANADQTLIMFSQVNKAPVIYMTDARVVNED